MSVAQQLAEIEAEFTIVSREHLNPRATIAPTAPIAPLTIIRNEFDEYRAIKAVNWSKLKNMRDSPLHYLHGLTAPDVDSPARLLGRAGHTLTLEPEKFEREYAVYEGDGSTASIDYKAFMRQNPGKQIVKLSGYSNAKAIADSVRNHPVAGPLLTGALVEQTLRWTDKITGLLCKARLDFFNPDTLLLGDLKTSVSVQAHRFGSLSARMGYSSQVAGHYYNGIVEALGWTPKHVKIIAVESKAPYDVAVFTLDEQHIEFARNEVARLLQQVADCTASGKWPGQYPEEIELSKPTWIYGGTDEITYDEEISE